MASVIFIYICGLQNNCFDTILCRDGKCNDLMNTFPDNYQRSKLWEVLKEILNYDSHLFLH